MGIYIPVYTLLPTFAFDATQTFSKTTIFKNSLIELTSKHMT